MRKTLLIAAAALAASVISSEAQVYSQNIVGYVNTPLAGNGAYSMLVTPVIGSTNAADQILTSLQQGDVLYLWTGANYASDTYIGGNAGPAGQNWVDQNNNWIASPTLSPGQGYFYSTQSGSTETNTFTGTVILTNSIAFPGNGAYSLVGSTPPVAGALDGTNIALPLQQGDVVYLWTGNGYNSDTYIGGNAGPAGQNWVDQNNNWISSPVVNVGQGFFYSTQSGSAETWNQNLVIQ